MHVASPAILPILLLTLTLLTPGCGKIAEDSGDRRLDHRSDDVYRVAVARFSHETCTFCPGGHPGIEDWTRSGTSRSWNQEEVFDDFVGWMLAELGEAMPVNGVFLSLHGVGTDPVPNFVTQ